MVTEKHHRAVLREREQARQSARVAWEARDALRGMNAQLKEQYEKLQEEQSASERARESIRVERNQLQEQVRQLEKRNVMLVEQANALSWLSVMILSLLFSPSLNLVGTSAHRGKPHEVRTPLGTGRAVVLRG